MFSNGKYTYGSSAFFSSLPVITKVNSNNLIRIKDLVRLLSETYTNDLYEELNKEVYCIYNLTSEEINYIRSVYKKVGKKMA